MNLNFILIGGPTQYQLSGVIPGPGFPPVTEMMLSFAVATPSMLRMEPLPMFVCGGPGKYGQKEKKILESEYIDHLKVYVLESVTAEDVSRPSLTASVNLVTEAMKADGPRSEGGKI